RTKSTTIWSPFSAHCRSPVPSDVILPLGRSSRSRSRPSPLALAERSHTRQVARDVLLVRPARAPADLEQLRVAPQPLHPVLPDVAVAAEHLDRAVGDLLGHRRAEQLDAG